MMKTLFFKAAGAMTIALVTFGTQAASGQGVVNFSGTVITAPCGISPESADQSIDFGQISKSHLEAGGISVKKNLDIKLVGCDATALAQTGSANVTFTGVTITGAPTELGTTGSTGTAIVISSEDGRLVSFGNAGSAQKLKVGDNLLRYSAWVKTATGGTLAEGDFASVANFNITYQ
ncbi:type 1 fimbrial protein [Edwardsiella piscicida]|nr:type 1 fimbrial protein [Edwardsiella piscicida]ELM3728622.1 type 1 fimbrial protein [Edwardsiella piscicida]ELV7537323.1 type 1 fimbrial protein [Edwardsiella piscicida]